jgi:thiol-disulfide isomerase/thioredoxin
MTQVLLYFFLAVTLVAQSKPAAKQQQQQEEELSEALGEVGSSPVEFLRVVEKHLAKYPDSPRRAELERAAVRAAIELKDEKRTILFGERVLARDKDDTQILERVSRALLNSTDKDRSERALRYAKRMEVVVHAMRKDAKPEWVDEIDRAEARAMIFEARAHSNLGRPEESLPLARRAYELHPTAEGAREISRTFEKMGKLDEAVVHLADAFTIPDTRVTDAERTRDRAKMGELYRRAKGSESGLGDIVLAAYDRTTALVRDRQARAAKADPNLNAATTLDFTLPAIDGSRLALASLKGKVIVFDFWATWCGPCRAQHPLYEKVKAKFRGNDAVVFLSINTDEDRAAVKPFLEGEKWSDKVYFDDGLQRALQISSIPTTIVLDRNGQVYSRLNGFVPHRFVDMLAERIRDALTN